MSWRWLVADGVRPRAGAREALEAAAARRPDARIVASRVVGPGTEPWPELFDRERAIAAAQDRLLAVRAVPAASLLVRHDVPGVPRGSGLAWTAAALRHGGGYLAPESIVDWPTAPRRRAAEHARLLVLPGLTVTERLWVAFLAVRRQP
jgi:hypothetical protein